MIDGSLGSFDILEQPLTSEEVTVTYTPSSTVKSYTYEVIKNGKTYDTGEVKTFRSNQITLYESGEYKIVIKTLDKNNIEGTLESGIYRLDLDAPSIICTKKSFDIYQNGDVKTLEQQIKENIIANDKQDGNLKENIVINLEDLHTDSLGTQMVTYSVSDAAGNTTTKSLPISVIEDNRLTLLGFQIGFICIVLVLLGWFIRYRRSIKLEKRFSKYSVEAVYDRRVSIVDSMMNWYIKGIKKLSSLLQKSSFLQKYAKHYEKYIALYKEVYEKSMDFVAVKFLSSLLFLVLAVLAKTLQSEVMHLYEIIFPLFVGFLVPDIVYISKYKLHRNRLENDLLQAIIVMNNAFKSGRSIEQAIDLVTKELDGPICEEFKKMHLEISFGLSVDVVFRRFAERIELEEVSYLTASLSILNKTGGNIIKVFTSIEKTLFNKKKLRLELASLTSGSKIIVYMLIAIPILFVVSISLINPTYFESFYTTTIGMILMGIIIIIYVSYIFCVRKIMKVRM